MLNQVVLVGRLTKQPEVKKAENGVEYSHITLAVPRTYKNAEGDYDTDFVDCTLWQMIAKNTAEYCKKGDLVGVKGHIETDTYEKDGETKYKTSIIAEKVTFLSNKKEKEQEEKDLGKEM